MKQTGSTVEQIAVRMICAIAMLFVGFAHQPMAADAREFNPAELARYILPDGSLPVICTTYQTEDGQKHGKVHSQGCEACRISAAVLLPTPVDQTGLRLDFERTVGLPWKAEAFRRQLFPPNTGPRAPPSDLIIA